MQRFAYGFNDTRVFSHQQYKVQTKTVYIMMFEQLGLHNDEIACMQCICMMKPSGRLCAVYIATDRYLECIPHLGTKMLNAYRSQHLYAKLEH